MIEKTFVKISENVGVVNGKGILTSALEGGGCSEPRPARFTPRKSRYPLYRRLGSPQSRSGRVWKISPLPEFDPRTVQPVASRYTDWAIPAPTLDWSWDFIAARSTWLAAVDQTCQRVIIPFGVCLK
jgi:hypothetical protein